MSSEGLWESPEADSRSNFNALGHGTLSEATVRALHACQAWTRAAEPDFEIDQERNVCEAADNAERPRSPGPARAAARRQGPRTAANRTGSPNPTVFFCDIKDLLAERAGFEPTVRASVQRFSSLMILVPLFTGYYHRMCPQIGGRPRVGQG